MQLGGFATIPFPVMFISGVPGQSLVTTPKELDARGCTVIWKPVVVFLNAVDKPGRENKDLLNNLCFTGARFQSESQTS